MFFSTTAPDMDHRSCCELRASTVDVWPPRSKPTQESQGNCSGKRMCFSFLFISVFDRVHWGWGWRRFGVVFLSRGRFSNRKKKKLRCPDAVSMMLKPRELVKKDILFTSGDEAR